MHGQHVPEQRLDPKCRACARLCVQASGAPGYWVASSTRGLGPFGDTAHAPEVLLPHTIGSPSCCASVVLKRTQTAIATHSPVIVLHAPRAPAILVMVILSSSIGNRVARSKTQKGHLVEALPRRYWRPRPAQSACNGSFCRGVTQATASS